MNAESDRSNDLLGQVGVGESDPWVFLNSIRSAAGVIYARGDDFMVDYLGSVTGVTDAALWSYEQVS